jgi:hypothetical protein
MAFQVGSALGISTLTSIYGGTEQASDFLTAYLVGAGIGALALVFAAMMRSTAVELRRVDTETARDAGQPASVVAG